MNRLSAPKASRYQCSPSTRREMNTCFEKKCAVSNHVVSHFKNDGVSRLHGSYSEDEHFKQSLLSIRMAADVPGEKHHAVILGSGNLTDIPIEFLTKNYQKVTLVDIDTDSSKLAVMKRFSGKAPENIVYEQADLTGIMDRLCSDINQVIEKLPEKGHVEDERLLKIFESEMCCIYRNALLQEGYLPDLHGDFISASLILSQLGVFVRDYAQTCFSKKYDFPEIPDLTQKTPEFETLNETMQKNFLMYLRSICRGGGVIYLGISKSFLIQSRAAGEEKWRLDVQGTLVKNAVVKPWLKQFFPKAKQSWKWCDLNGDGLRRTFDIDAYTLWNSRSITGGP